MQRTRMRFDGVGPGRTPPSMRLASSEKNSTKLAAYAISARACVRGSHQVLEKRVEATAAYIANGRNYRIKEAARSKFYYKVKTK